MGAQEVQIVKWVVDQGGVFGVVIVIFLFYRKDFLTILKNMSTLIEQNIIAMQEMKASIDLLNERRREYDEQPRRNRGDR